MITLGLGGHTIPTRFVLEDGISFGGVVAYPPPRYIQLPVSPRSAAAHYLRADVPVSPALLRFGTRTLELSRVIPLQEGGPAAEYLPVDAAFMRGRP